MSDKTIDELELELGAIEQQIQERDARLCGMRNERIKINAELKELLYEKDKTKIELIDKKRGKK